MNPLVHTSNSGPISHGLSETELEQRVRRVKLIAFDFDGVFTDNLVYVFEDGREAVRCTRADGIGLQKLAKLGINAVVVSTETNPVVAARSRKLSIRCLQGCQDKFAVMESLLQEFQLDWQEAAFVGNDVNDLPCLKSVGLPIVVRDAHPDVLPWAVLQTSTLGGHGAVREVCDYIERCRGM